MRQPHSCNSQIALQFESKPRPFIEDVPVRFGLNSASIRAWPARGTRSEGPPLQRIDSHRVTETACNGQLRGCDGGRSDAIFPADCFNSA